MQGSSDSKKIDISQYTGIIFTSRGAIDHYFRLAEELRFQVPDSMRYICQSEAVANYLQKTYCLQKEKNKFWRENSGGYAAFVQKNFQMKNTSCHVLM